MHAVCCRDHQNEKKEFRRSKSECIRVSTSCLSGPPWQTWFLSSVSHTCQSDSAILTDWPQSGQPSSGWQPGWACAGRNCCGRILPNSGERWLPQPQVRTVGTAKHTQRHTQYPFSLLPLLIFYRWDIIMSTSSLCQCTCNNISQFVTHGDLPPKLSELNNSYTTTTVSHPLHKKYYSHSTTYFHMIHLQTFTMVPPSPQHTPSIDSAHTRPTHYHRRYHHIQAPLFFFFYFVFFHQNII